MRIDPTWADAPGGLIAGVILCFEARAFSLTVKMSPGKYLPLHSGVPISISSSPPVKLTTVSAVEAFLSSTPFASQRIMELPGGTINYVYRVHLRTPFEGRQTVVLKHAQPFWKSAACNLWEVERQTFEVEAMTRVRSGLCPTLPIQIPQIHHFDVHNSVIIMEDCGDDVITLGEFLCSGRASSLDLAQFIGAALGECIALVHEWSKSNPNGILDTFENSLHAKRTTADLNYDRLVATLQCSDKDDLPLLSDFKTTLSDIQTISELTGEYHSHLMSTRVPGQDVFLMGDLWHENILISAEQRPPRLYILDWELARTGLPGSEIGLFCASLELLGQGSQVAREPVSIMLRSFLDTYSRISSRDARLAQDALAHWGISFVFWTPRDPPGNKELVQNFVRKGVEFLVRSRDQNFLAQSPLKGLLPKSIV